MRKRVYACSRPDSVTYRLILRSSCCEKAGLLVKVSKVVKPAEVRLQQVELGFKKQNS